MTKMMMLILSIIVMCSYLYLVCLLYRVLKKPSNTFQCLLPNITINNTQNNTQSKLCPMFKYSPNGKGIVYGPSEI